MYYVHRALLSIARMAIDCGRLQFALSVYRLNRKIGYRRVGAQVPSATSR